MLAIVQIINMKTKVGLRGLYLIINTPAYKFLFFLLHVNPVPETKAPTAGCTKGHPLGFL